MESIIGIKIKIVVMSVAGKIKINQNTRSSCFVFKRNVFAINGPLIRKCCDKQVSCGLKMQRLRECRFLKTAALYRFGLILK